MAVPDGLTVAGSAGRVRAVADGVEASSPVQWGRHREFADRTHPLPPERSPRPARGSGTERNDATTTLAAARADMASAITRSSGFSQHHGSRSVHCHVAAIGESFSTPAPGPNPMSEAESAALLRRGRWPARCSSAVVAAPQLGCRPGSPSRWASCSSRRIGCTHAARVRRSERENDPYKILKRVTKSGTRNVVEHSPADSLGRHDAAISQAGKVVRGAVLRDAELVDQV